jgi:hypothetical protein
MPARGERWSVYDDGVGVDGKVDVFLGVVGEWRAAA